MTVEDLKEFGLEEMTDEEIGNFLSSEGVGVLGLPGKAAPYLIPLSFGYDGDRRLYFTFFVGEDSRKRDLSERAETARFLVYSAVSPFFWESVVVTGTIAQLPAEAWTDHEAALENAWHLDLFERVDTPGMIELYEFTIRERRGIKQTGLPPGFRDGPGDESTD